jgi:hypothetical protein
VEQRKQRRGWHQHFIGSWARLNCENMPVIPAWLVRSNFNDSRRIPYLLVWKDERHGGRIVEAVRLVCYSPGPLAELKRTDGSTTVLRTVSQMMPRNGGQALLLLCPYCDTPRRFVYGWEWDSFSGWSNRVRSISRRCRSCAQLRYSSEGGYLRPACRRLGKIGTILGDSWGNLPRPELWLSYVFTSPQEAAEVGARNRPGM